MLELANKHVLVVGLDEPGVSACLLLRREGARVEAVDPGKTPLLHQQASRLRTLGIPVHLGQTAVPRGDFALAVLSSGTGQSWTRRLDESRIARISEVELGLQMSRCLAVAVSGTNGKSTTAGLIERMLKHNNRRAFICGPSSRPVTSVVEQSRELDFLVTQVDSFQLETVDFLRPAVAVLLNVASDHLDRYADADAYTRSYEPLFRSQQFYDWIVIQSAALERCRALELDLRARIISFSATDSQADLFLDRGRLISRLPNWPGLLLNLDHCLLRGPHNAENLMAALAVGHVLRLPLEGMVDALKTFPGGAHRCELVAEMNGVQFINDSKARNVDALEKALLTTRPGLNGEPNVWLIAGGQDSHADFHAVGPLISRRVKGAFLIGEVSRTIRSAWSLFTPCKLAASLLEAVAEAARNATSGDVVLLSPACSGLDQFRNHQHRGQSFCEAVKSIGRGERAPHPHIHGLPVPA